MTSLAGQIRVFLILAFSFVPFTSLRFGALGIGEIIILFCAFALLYMSRNVLTFYKSMLRFYRFWFVYLFVIIVGLSYNAFFLGFSSGREFTGFFDFLSYVFILLTILILSERKLYIGDSPQDFFSRLFLVWGAVFCFFYIVSLFFSSVLGFQLRYYNYFSPLVDNVHQAASITCVMPFVMFHLAVKSDRLFLRTIYAVMGVLFARMALESGSTKAFMGLVVGSLASVGFFLFYKSSGRYKISFNVVSLFFLALISIVFLTFYFDSLSDFAVEFFTENDGEDARKMLYMNGFRHALDSFVFWYGPGSHAPYASGFSDAHNTFLTIFLQGGLIAILIFVFFLIGVFRSVSGSFLLVGAFFSIFMYVLGGDILRRLPVWVMLIGIYYLSVEQGSALKINKPATM